MGSRADSPLVSSLAMAGADGVVGEVEEAGASTGAGEAVRMGAGEAVGLGTSTGVGAAGVGAAGVGDNSRNRSSIDLQHI